MNKPQASAVSVATAPIDLGQLLEPVKLELEEVERFLNSNLVDDSTFIVDLLGQVFKAGGKRLRPALVLLSAKATSPRQAVGRLHIILAVLTELIHTASLVHDDVIDSAGLRRGQETVNKKFSDKLAVLTGDLLFAQASVCLARLSNPPVVGIYGQVLGDLCAGEIRQMRHQFATTVDWNTYVQKSIWKTASLFAAGTQSAAILNRRPTEIEARMKSYGLNLGICFQMVDDLLDVTGTSQSLGKPAGSDLSNGVVTAPAMFILEGNDEPARRLAELIKTRGVSAPEGIEEALTIIRKHGGIEQTIELASSYARAACDALSQLPKSPYRDSLEALTEWLMTRTN